MFLKFAFRGDQVIRGWRAVETAGLEVSSSLVPGLFWQLGHSFLSGIEPGEAGFPLPAKWQPPGPWQPQLTVQKNSGQCFGQCQYDWQGRPELQLKKGYEVSQPRLQVLGQWLCQ